MEDNNFVMKVWILNVEEERFVFEVCENKKEVEIGSEN